jgi:hypothetical protein
MVGNINVAELLDGYVTDLANVNLFEVRFWTTADSGTYTVSTFGFSAEPGSITAPVTTPPPVTATAPPVTSPGTNDSSPFYLALLGIGILLALAVALPKLRKN